MTIPLKASTFTIWRHYACVLPWLALGLMWIAAMGCSKPKLPEDDKPPEPIAPPASTTATTPTHTELRDAIQQPIDRANAAQVATEAAARAHDAQIEAATSE